MTKSLASSTRQVDYENLKARLGEESLRERLLTHANHWADKVFQGEGIFKLERFLPMDRIITWILKLTGTYAWGHRNFHDIQVIENQVDLTLASSKAHRFHAYRILHLSDLHLDLCPSLTDVIIQKVQNLEYDFAVITGDFRNSSTANYQQALDETRKVVEALNRPVYGILGNHDFIEMVEGLESLGIHMLLNEWVNIDHDGARLMLAGIDVPHFYRTERFETFRPGIEASDLSVLLSHSPETYRKAASYGFHFMLAGHTHGGQICLPGGRAILKIGNCPNEMLAGAWDYSTLHGYTSRGTGSCGVPVRYFCPPEVTLHELRTRSD